MGENTADSVLSGEGKKCGHILRINILCLSAPGIAGEKLECIGVYFYSLFSHGEVGKMASDGKHDEESPFSMILM